MRRFLVCCTLGLLACALAPAAAQAAPTITLFQLGLPVGATPLEVAANPADGFLGRLTSQWGYTGFDRSDGDPGISDIAAGPDGNLWFTESKNDAIGRITPGGVVTIYAPSSLVHTAPRSIAAGGDGNMYF